MTEREPLSSRADWKGRGIPPDGGISDWISALRSRGCKPKREGKGWRASCPTNAHENGNRRNPALHVEEGSGGKVLATCHAGCEFERHTGGAWTEPESKQRLDVDAPRDGALRAGTGAREGPKNTPGREHRRKPLPVSHG